jgi:hypothetical protein
MVNKRDANVSIVCLSYHFFVGQFPYHRAGGAPLAFSMILSHPKILECEINKIGTMFACLDLKFHRDLKPF